MAEAYLPAEIVWREKRGMGVPVTEWCLGPLRRAALRVVSVDLNVAELGIRDQDPIVEQCAADPRAEGEHHDRALLIDAGAELHLGQPGRVGVVE